MAVDGRIGDAYFLSGGSGVLPPPIIGTSAGTVNMTGTPQSLGTVSLPAPESGTDHYLIFYSVSESLHALTATGGTNRSSVFSAEDGAGPISDGYVNGALIAQTLSAPITGNTRFNSTKIFRYDCTGAETITVYGAVSFSFTGVWQAEGGAQIIAQKVGNTP